MMHRFMVQAFQDPPLCSSTKLIVSLKFLTNCHPFPNGSFAIVPHTLCAERVAALRHQPEVRSKGGVETDLAVQLLAPEDLLLLPPVVL